MDETEHDAARRRAAFKRFLDDRKLTASEIARAADFPNANAIYNFLNERSQSLAQKTYEKISAAFGVTIATLTGEAGPVSGGVRTITVRSEVQAGRFRPAFDLPLPEQTEIPIPLPADAIASGAFGVTVRGPGAEALYPDETILTCLPLSCFEQPLKAGLKLIVQRTNPGGVEVTVRELQLSNGRPWLWLRSTHPEFQQTIECDAPISPRQWVVGNDRFRVVAVVTGSYRSELGV